MSQQIFSNKDWGVFVGTFKKNKQHQHFAIQLSLGLEYELELKEANSKKIKGDSFLIKSNIPHQLACKGNQILFLINPLSSLGHYLLNYIKEDFQPFSHEMITEIRTIALKLLRQEVTCTVFVAQLDVVLNQFICACENHSSFIDERIKVALNFISQHEDRVIPAKELSEIVCLSESRFLHLFKKEVGLTYRRAQLWNRVAKSILDLKTKSVTEVAYHYGFSDSSHYNKIVNQTFGFSPKEFLQYS